jgi:hypothetical protein
MSKRKSEAPATGSSDLTYTLTVHAGQSQWPMLMEQGNDWLIAALELG